MREGEIERERGTRREGERKSEGKWNKLGQRETGNQTGRDSEYPIDKPRTKYGDRHRDRQTNRWRGEMNLISMMLQRQSEL